jgi:peroxiredoxin
MKASRIFTFILILLIFASCKDFNSFVVTGEIENLENKDIYLVSQTNSSAAVDTIHTKNGKFRFRATSETSEPFVIYMEGGNTWVTFWAKNEEKISLEGKVDYPELVTINGNEINNLLTEFKTDNKDLLKEKRDLLNNISVTAKQTDDPNAQINKSRFSSQTQVVDMELRLRAKTFVQEHPTSIASLVLIQDFVMDADDASDMQSCLSLIEGEAKENDLFQKLETWSLKDRLTMVGQPAPQFNIIDTQNDTITLDNFKNKYLLLNFAASWCVCCNDDYAEWSNIRKAFSKDTLEILTVSLDENIGDWQKLAEEKEISWTQTVDNMGWASQLASLYNVSEVPTNYLINREGEIIGSKMKTDSIRAFLEKEVRVFTIDN